MKVRDALNRLRDFATVRHRLVALSLVRICFGTIILTYYAQHVAQRAFIWGNNGVLPFPFFYAMMRAEHNFSFDMLSPSPVYQTQAMVSSCTHLTSLTKFACGYRISLRCNPRP